MAGGRSYCFELWEVPLPFIAPSFYKMDLSEVPIMIGAFAMGPLAAAVIELIKILLNFVLNGTTTAGVGELGNFIMGCALVMPAGFIYKQAKTKKHAIIGMATGIVCMAVASALVNGLLLLPAYGKSIWYAGGYLCGDGSSHHSGDPQSDNVLPFQRCTV